MSLIAARLGGSKGTLYAYFPSKDALFRAVAAQESADLRAELFMGETPERPAGRRLTDLAARFLAALMRPRAVAFQRMIIAESGRFPELGRAFYETGPRDVHAEFARILASMIWRGELRSADPAAAAEVFVDLIASGAVLRSLWTVEAAPAESEVVARVTASVELFLRAYAP